MQRPQGRHKNGGGGVRGQEEGNGTVWWECREKSSEINRDEVT